MNTSWPFDQPENCAVISVRQVMLEGAPVLLVAHDEEDHGWQFLAGGEFRTEDGVVVSFRSVVLKDPTLLEIADLPPGWQAHRNGLGATWVREKIESE